ncbi:MAG: hypothetical protein KDA45_07580 [Planctomycetales bacterium]|nr:hypothetical protein [Planctomycetales bacterium]
MSVVRLPPASARSIAATTCWAGLRSQFHDHNFPCRAFLERWFFRGVLCCVALALASSCLPQRSRLRAEEPYQRFLQKLHDERLFDLALVYLADLESQSDVSRDLQADIQMERALLLYQSAAVMGASNPQRPLKLDEAEAVLRDFLETRKNHPRRGEARLKLGELLLTRAEEAKMRAADGDPQQDIAEAVQFYDDAYRLFESTIEELTGVYEKIKGARLDPANTTQMAYRQKIQQSLRQAQLLSARSVQERGRSRGLSNPQRQADLEQALAMFSDLYAKEQRMVGVRNYALFYRSEIQAALGKVEDAIDGFQRIADLQGVDILRPLQTQAVSELVKLLGQQKKYPLVVDRAEKWLAELRPDERATPSTVTLQLDLATQKIAWAQQLEANDPDDRVAGRLKRDVRGQLRLLLRVPGAHQQTARDLLGQLGAEVSEPPSSELPEVKDFAQALAAAQERIDRAESAAIGLENLQLELADAQTSEERKAELTEQLQTVQAAIEIDQQQTLALLREALRLYSSSDDRDLLFDARFRLAYVLLKQQRPWDALVVSEFLCRSSAGTEQGLRAAAITLGAYSDLLRTAGAEEKAVLTEQLQPLAEYLVQTWPESAEAAAAAAALVQLALMSQQWDQAEQMLKLVPAGGETAGKLRRDAGILFYAKYLEQKKAAGEESEATLRLKRSALQALQAGLQEVTADNLTPATIEAINALTRLLLLDGQLDAAAQWMLDGPRSPLQALAKQPDLIPARAAMDTYRTAIQLVSSRVVEGKLSVDAAVAQMRDYIQQLQTAAAGDPQGSEALAGTFVALASDLHEQLSAMKQEAKREKLSSVLLLLAVEAAKSDSFNTRYWAADTILLMADELQTSAAGRTQAQAAYSAAANILEGILAQEQQQPGWIQPAGLSIQLRLKLAQTQRGLNDFKAAIDELSKILSAQNSLLDVQIEAARTYQAWGTAVNPGFHKVAVIGALPDPKTGQRLVWGWGKISQMTANQPDFSEQFFDARYQLAFSRLQYAVSLPNAQQRTEELERAEHDVQSTARLYPTLGGPAMKEKFNALLKSIQSKKKS